MSAKREFSDEELVAFLDGENDFAPVSEIRAALDKDVSLQARLQQLSIDTDLIRETFSRVGPALETAVPAGGIVSDFSAAPAVPVRQSRSFSFSQMAAAAILALGIGFGVSTLTTDGGDRSWQDYVASYQALYATSTLAHIERPQDEMSAELTRVSAAIGKAIEFDAVGNTLGVDYKRAQILSYKGQPLIQLAFLSQGGVPYALCILKTGEGSADKVVLDEMQGMSSAFWSNGEYEYLLIGGDDESVISQLAKHYAARI